MWSSSRTPNESIVATISQLLSFDFHACGFVLVSKKIKLKKIKIIIITATLLSKNHSK